MTLLSRRKRRTTVRSITATAAAAAKAALLVALLAAPAVAQPGAQLQSGQGPSNGLPLPRGYQPRTPPPQAQPQPQLQRPAPGATPGSAGTVMYFQKPADALTATGGGLPSPGDGVAQLGARGPAGRPAPDAPPARVLAAPTDHARPAWTAPAIPLGRPPVVTPAQFQPQPDDKDKTSTSQKQPPKEVPLEEIQLPPREKIFGIVYNDRELEAAVAESIRRDQAKNNPPVILTDEQLRFPPLPVISPPGVAYRSKTATYPPRTLAIEPMYVVHRRLHFEDKNTERAGWDLGPLQTLASAGLFYRQVLFWPYNLASGLTHGFWDTSAGKCLPGSPSPYYLYPHALTLTGTVAEAGIITGAAFLLP